MRPLPSIERYIASDYYQRRKIRAQYERRGVPPPDLRTGKPSPLKGRERPRLRGPRGPLPHKWITGPDPIRHDKFVAWHRHRSQANHRREPYALTFEEFETIWGELWSQRGRGSDDLCLTRQDPELAWDATNTIVITRKQHLTRMRQ